MPIGAIVGSTVVGAGASIISGNKAASAVQNAADQSAAVQKQIFDQTRADNAPWRAVGTNALYRLAGLNGLSTKDPNAPETSAGGYYTLPNGQRVSWGGVAGAAMQQSTHNTAPDYSSFYTSPDYRFRLNEGLKAIQNSAAARGQRFSGATMKALSDYAGNAASQEYGNYYGRIAQLAGFGQSANSANQQAGQTYANGASSAYTNAGNARASAYQNTGNAINGGIQNLAGAYLYGKGYSGGGGFGGGSTSAGGWDYGIGYG